MRYPHLAARIFNTPLLIAPGKLDAIIAGLGGRLLGNDIQHEQITPGLITTAQGERKQPGYRVVDGVAVLDIFGVLTHRGSMDMAASSYMLGYQDIARQFQAALSDPDVVGILLNMDTPGGEVGGVWDLANQITAARGIKPIRAIAGESALSAGYLIGSAADEFAITSTGYAGSIGVVMRHVDFSAALAADGVRVTHIFAGDHKIDGNPYEPLPDAVRASFQTEIDGLYQMFIDTVAAARGLSADAVRATQAGVYRGADAVAIGLADRVSTPDQMITELRSLSSKPRAQRVAARATTERRQSMSQQESGGENLATFTQTDLDAARAEGHRAGMTAGTEAERARVSGILTHAEAEGRTALAHQCITTGLSAEQAAAILAASPKQAAPAAAGNAFAAAMAGIGNPDVKPDAAAAQESDAQATAANIVALFQGRKAN